MAREILLAVLFYVVFGPLFGTAVFLLMMTAGGDGSEINLGSILVFLAFGYLLGGIPAGVAGVASGLFYSSEKPEKSGGAIHVLIGGIGAVCSLFLGATGSFLWFGITGFVSAATCSLIYGKVRKNCPSSEPLNSEINLQPRGRRG